MKPCKSTVGLPQYGTALRRRLPMPLYRPSYTFNLIVTPPGTLRAPLMRDGIFPPREPRAAFSPRNMGRFGDRDAGQIDRAKAMA